MKGPGFPDPSIFIRCMKTVKGVETLTREYWISFGFKLFRVENFRNQHTIAIVVEDLRYNASARE